MGLIQVFTSQCCYEVKLDRTIGLSFNLKVRQAAGTPWDKLFAHEESEVRTSDSGPANSAPSRNPEFLPAPPRPAPRGPPQQPRKNGNLGASAPTGSGRISSDHRVQARLAPSPTRALRPRTQGKSSRTQTPKAWGEASAHLTWSQSTRSDSPGRRRRSNPLRKTCRTGY